MKIDLRSDKPADDATCLADTGRTMAHRLQGRAEADGFRRAWGDALDRLKTVVEG